MAGFASCASAEVESTGSEGISFLPDFLGFLTGGGSGASTLAEGLVAFLAGFFAGVGFSFPPSTVNSYL